MLLFGVCYVLFLSNYLLVKVFRMLEKGGFEKGLPVQAEIPIRSEMRV